MRKVIPFIVVAVLLSGCGGGGDDTAASTAPSVAPSSASSSTTTSITTTTVAPLTPELVVDRFRAAGLEAESVRPMETADYGFAPRRTSSGLRFFIPSLGDQSGGRILAFGNQEDLEATKSYYDELGRDSTATFSWTFVNDLILVQINGQLPEAQARQYETALQG